MSASVGLESVDTLMYAAVDLLLGYCFLVPEIAIFVVPDAKVQASLKENRDIELVHTGQKAASSKPAPPPADL